MDGRFFLTKCHSAIRGLRANGKNAITATVHLQNARLMGEMLSLNPRATIKLPDQMAVAPRASR